MNSNCTTCGYRTFETTRCGLCDREIYLKHSKSGCVWAHTTEENRQNCPDPKPEGVMFMETDGRTF